MPGTNVIFTARVDPVSPPCRQRRQACFSDAHLYDLAGEQPKPPV